MPKITFRGKIYYSEFEMPPNVRRAYEKEQIRQTNIKPMTDVVDMPAEVEEVYRRAMDRDEQSNSSPSTQGLPSNESIYQPSAPIIDPEYSTIVPESSFVIRGLVFGILWSLVLAAIVFLVIELFRQIL
jgi:hypothetical protein